MVSTGGVLTATAEPSTQAYLGVGCDSTQSTLRFFSSSSSVDLGANFPSNTQNIDLYEFRLFIPPNGNTTYWSVTRLNTGHYIEGSLATPSKTTLVGPQIWINNAGTASAVAIDVISQYIETDT